MFGRSIGTRMLLFVAVVLFQAQTSSAQSTTVTFTTSSPSGVITALITVPGLCDNVPTTVVNGSTIQMTLAFSNCIGGPPSFTITEFVPFGPLPAGTYNYELYFQYENEPPTLQVRQPLVIAAASIPMLDSLPLLLLGVALLASGLLALRRG